MGNGTRKTGEMRMTIEEWAKDFKSYVNELQMFRDDYKGIMEYIDDVLAILEAQERSGVWEWITEDKYRCSECKNVTYVDECMNEPQYLYCPYCGCKMTFEGRVKIG